MRLHTLPVVCAPVLLFGLALLSGCGASSTSSEIKASTWTYETVLGARAISDEQIFPAQGGAILVDPDFGSKWTRWIAREEGGWTRFMNMFKETCLSVDLAEAGVKTDAPCTGVNTQWRVMQVPGEYMSFYVQNRASGKCLAVPAQPVGGAGGDLYVVEHQDGCSGTRAKWYVPTNLASMPSSDGE